MDIGQRAAVQEIKGHETIEQDTGCRDVSLIHFPLQDDRAGNERKKQSASYHIAERRNPENQLELHTLPHWHEHGREL